MSKITPKQIIKLTDEYSRIKTLVEHNMTPIDFGAIKEILYDIGMIDIGQNIDLKEIEMMYDTIVEPYF